MEFLREASVGFEESVRLAADLGYRAIEPVVHTGWDQFSEVRYSPSFSMEEDPMIMREICDQAGVEVAAIAAHSPLMKPEAAVPRLTHAIQLAATVGARCVNTNEKNRPEWMDDDQAFEIMRYTIKRANIVAQRYGINLLIEQDGQFTRSLEGLMHVVNLVPSPWIGINWDTGNAYLAGIDDPYEALAVAAPRIRHVHLKDLTAEFAARNRGRMTGALTGCAIGEGIIDWDKVFHVLDTIDRELFLSVQCGSVDQAAASLEFLRKRLAGHVVPGPRAAGRLVAVN